LENEKSVLDKVKEVIDAVLTCIERERFVYEEFSSWTHDVAKVEGRGVEVYRVVTYGTIRVKNELLHFMATSYVSRIGNEMSPVETRLALSNGRIMEFRPEVEFEKCLRDLGLEPF